MEDEKRPCQDVICRVSLGLSLAAVMRLRCPTTSYSVSRLMVEFQVGG
jgi:hypothetical protein